MDSANQELTRLSNLIGLIYEGATDPSRWTKDILPAVADYMQMPQCLIFTTLHTPQTGGYLFNYGLDQPHMDLYTNKYQQEDVWIHAGLERGVFFDGNVVIGEDMVPREQFVESKIYKEFFSKRSHMGQMLGGIIFWLDSTNSMPATCALMRGLDTPAFNEDDRNRMRLILPHISRSLGVMQRIRTAELTVATTLSALDRLPSGVLLLDAGGTVAFANRAAERMLEEGDGLRLRNLSGNANPGDLVADNAVAGKAIQDAIGATLKRDPYVTPHFSKCVAVPRTSGLASYTLQFSALGKHNEFGAFAAVIFIADGARDLEVDPAVLQRAYGLTPAEARVAVTLLECSSAQEVADTLGTSPNTVRSQIKQIYAKLGVDTRARFVKLLLGLATHRP